MPARLVVLCGGPDVSGQEGRLGRPPPARRQAVLALAYLVLARGRSVPADELAEAVWPQGPPQAWPAGLRRVVSEVRSWLRDGDVEVELRAVHGTYELLLPDDVSSDVDAARAHLQAARIAGEAGSADEEAAAARRSVDHLLQPLLPAYDASWLLQVRRDLERELLEALDLLADAERRRGNTDAALAAAERAIAVDPLRESSHRLAMAAHRGAGRIGAALRQYEACRRILADEVGSAPSPTTTAAYHALLDLQLDKPPTQAAGLPTPGVGEGLGAAAETMHQLERSQTVATLEARLATIDANPAPDPRRRVDTLIELGRARWLLAGSTEALRRISLAAGEVALGLGLSDAFADSLVLASTTTGIGQIDPDAWDLCVRGHAAFPSDPRVQVEVQGLQAELVFGPESIDRAQAAVDAARELGDDRLLLDMLLVLDQSLAWVPDIERRLEVVEECNQLSRSVPRSWRRRPTFEVMTRLQAGHGDWLREMAARRPHVSPEASWEMRVYQSAMFAVGAMLEGDLADAHRRAVDLLASAGSELNTMHAAGGLLLALAREMGDLADLIPAIAAIVASNERIPAFRAALAAAHATVGDHDAASGILRDLVATGLDAAPQDHVYLLYVGLLAECVALVEETSLIDEVLDLLAPFAGQVCVGAHGIVVMNAMDAYRGMLSVVSGDPRGPEWFEAAMELEGHIGAELLRARTAGWFSAYLRRHGGAGDQARAAQLLADARAVADAAPDRVALRAMLDRLAALS